MRLKADQIDKLGTRIHRALMDQGLMKLKVEEKKVLERIRQAIHQNLEAEDLLEEEAQKLLDQFRPQIDSGQVNEREVFLKIKRELAKKKKMVL